MGLSVQSLVPKLQAFSQIDVDNYPETLGMSLVTNAPGFVSIIWSWISGWIDPVVASKVAFSGDAIPVLLERAFESKETIPVELGGELKGVFPARISEAQLISNCAAEEKKMGLTEIKLPPGESADVKFAVDTSSGPVEVLYFFRSKDYNVGFKVEYEQTSNDVLTEIKVPLSTVEAQIAPCKGKLYFPAAQDFPKGSLTFKFDNTSSWFNSKIVNYKIESRIAHPRV